MSAHDPYFQDPADDQAGDDYLREQQTDRLLAHAPSSLTCTRTEAIRELDRAIGELQAARERLASPDVMVRLHALEHIADANERETP